MNKKIYVLDTSVYLTNADSIHAYKNNDIIVPMKVLEELDKHKSRTDIVGSNARTIIRTFDDLRGNNKKSLKDGVRLGKGLGMVCTVSFEDTKVLPVDMDGSIPDNQILGVALQTKKKFPNRKVILVSRDIHMRVTADSLGLLSEGYEQGQVTVKREKLYTGYRDVLVDDEILDRFYAKESIFLTGSYMPNEFLMLRSNNDDKKTALARYTNKEHPLRRVHKYCKKDKTCVFSLETRNREQTYAMNVLLDDDVHLTTVIGRSGGGKTLLAVAAGLHKVLEEQKYSRLIISRPIQTVGKDIGFLPGTEREKQAPYTAPIEDNLQNLLGGDKNILQQYEEKGVIEVEAIAFIRGRSIDNAYMIIDEAQNLSIHELKTIITRAGQGTKIVLTGDIEQIDNMYVNEMSNGLTYAIEKFRDKSIAAHVTLLKGERSKLATIASEIL